MSNSHSNLVDELLGIYNLQLLNEEQARRFYEKCLIKYFLGLSVADFEAVRSACKAADDWSRGGVGVVA